MILDVLARLVLTLLEGLFSVLPDYEIAPPEESSMIQLLAKLDSVIPIAGVIQAAVVALSALAFFIAIRFAMMGWKALPFT